MSWDADNAQWLNYGILKMYERQSQQEMTYIEDIKTIVTILACIWILWD